MLTCLETYHLLLLLLLLLLLWLLLQALDA
jgi:hypothetical protein